MGGGGGGTTATVQSPVAAAAAKQQVAGDPRAEALRCPRCDSANTKFCYYNNYSLAQPRHFCKACKRYWTRGGTLRNVPVGGGCRKNKRSRGGPNSHNNHNGSKHSSTSSSVTSMTAATSSLPQAVTGQLPPLTSAALSLPGSSLASLLLGGGAGDHLSLFQAMQSVVPDAGAFELPQQPTSQVDHLLGLGYGGAVAQMPVKPWQQQLQDGGGGILDGFYAPLLSSSIVPGLEELQMCGKEVKVEASAGGDHHQQKTAAGDQQWELLPSSSSCVDATTTVTSEALVAAASMNLAVSSAATAPAASSLMYWSGGAVTAWPDISNCGSSIATLF